MIPSPDSADVIALLPTAAGRKKSARRAGLPEMARASEARPDREPWNPLSNIDDTYDMVHSTVHTYILTTTGHTYRNIKSMVHTYDMVHTTAHTIHKPYKHYSNVRTYIHTSVRTYINTCMHICIHTYPGVRCHVLTSDDGHDVHALSLDLHMKTMDYEGSGPTNIHIY